MGEVVMKDKEFNPEDIPHSVRGMVMQFAKVTGQKPDTRLYADLIAEEYEEWDFEYALGWSREFRSHYAQAYSPTNELKELADLVYVVYGYANAKGWDLDEAIRRVHVNNVGRCVQPDGTVKRREDGKILKREGYPKVNLEDLV